MTDIVSLEALAALFEPGQSVAIPVDNAGVSMAATAALIEAGITGLKLVCVPISGLQADLLIGAHHPLMYGVVGVGVVAGSVRLWLETHQVYETRICPSTAPVPQFSFLLCCDIIF